MILLDVLAMQGFTTGGSASFIPHKVPSIYKNHEGPTSSTVTCDHTLALFS